MDVLKLVNNNPNTNWRVVGDFMLLNIYGEIPSDDCLSIKANGESKTLCRDTDNTIPVVSFTVDEKKQYRIEIEQELTASNKTPLWILIHVITIVIQGVFNIFLLNTDSEWYNNIKAYRLRAKLLVDMQQDTDVCLTFTNSKYDKRTNEWSSPVFKAEPNVISDVDFVANPYDFCNQYFSYAKKVVSVLAVVILVMGLLLYIAVTHSNVVAIIITSVVIIGLVIVAAAVCISQLKKLRKTYDSFLVQDKNNA